MIIERIVDFIGHTVIVCCIVGVSGLLALLIILTLLPRLMDWGII